MVLQFFPQNQKAENIGDIAGREFLSSMGMPVFADQAVEFLHEISRLIFSGKESSLYPELTALAFFLRKSNINDLKARFEKSADASAFHTPRGVAFHIAPSNVDTIFVYSWALSLLAGNINIVRLSSKINEQVRILLDILVKMDAQNNYPEIAQRNILLNYEHDPKINEYISSVSDIRIIWGGNETISLIRSFSAKPTTKEIVFADKVSYSVIEAANYIESDEKTLGNTALAFYNDGYYFGQMGCSSPRIVYFSGRYDVCEKASALFWTKLAEAMKKKSHADDISVALNKHIEIYSKAAGPADILGIGNISDTEPTVVRIGPESALYCRETCGGGFFYECFIDNLDSLAPLVKDNDQTMTYSGFGKEELTRFAAKVNGRGIDRIVPIGSALSFSSLWDGYNLMYELTKSVSIL